MIRILYFGQLREMLGCHAEEWAEVPIAVSALLEQLRARSPAWREALDERTLCAVNQTLAKGHALIQDGDEVAFFPPVTGG